MDIQDERTQEEMKEYCWLVLGTDSYMSGWGLAEGGLSYAVWACKGKDVDQVEKWVKSRSDMKRVRVVHDPKGKYSPKGKGHCAIYVVHENHRALKF